MEIIKPIYTVKEKFDLSEAYVDMLQKTDCEDVQKRCLEAIDKIYNCPFVIVTDETTGKDRDE